MKDYTKYVITTKNKSKITIIQKNHLPAPMRISNQYLENADIIRTFDCLNGSEALIARDNVEFIEYEPMTQEEFNAYIADSRLGTKKISQRYQKTTFTRWFFNGFYSLFLGWQKFSFLGPSHSKRSRFFCFEGLQRSNLPLREAELLFYKFQELELSFFYP